MTDSLREKLGPLAALVGVWEGDKGDDIAPSDDRGTENNKFRERITFERTEPVENHEQKIHALRYSTRIARLGEEKLFHEELGYWTWEPSTGELQRCFVIPRGIALIAGGKAEAGATEFHLEARHGSTTFGICASPFLEREFKIVFYELNVKLVGPDRFSYEEDTVIQLPGKKELFHHRDQNTLMRTP